MMMGGGLWRERGVQELYLFLSLQGVFDSQYLGVNSGLRRCNTSKSIGVYVPSY